MNNIGNYHLLGAAAEPEFFWKLAVESNLLLPVNQENREQNAFWLADWLAQAPDWQLLLIMFKDLYHLADRKSVLLVLSRLVELTSKDQVIIPTPLFSN